MSIKLVDSLQSMGDFPVAFANSIECADGTDLETKLSTLNGSGGNSNIQTITEEEYQNLTDQEKLEGDFHCYDTGNLYYKGVSYGRQTDISTKQDNLNQVKFTIRRNSVNEPRYCMIASSDLSQNLLMCEPYRFKGIFGSSTESVEKKSLIDLYVSFREGAITDKVMKGYADSTEAFDYVDLIITVDETENRSYAYVDFLTSGSMCSGEITVPVLDAEKYMTFAESFELVDSMIGTELCRMSDYAKIITNIDDTQTSETSVWSSKKTSDEIDALISDTASSTTSTYSSAKINELNANRQVKTFNNTSSTTEKWYKICSALTTGIGCNIKLTASRADSTATVQYFSALFRDSRYRYTSSYISRERTVYEYALVAEYSAYIIADANNDIWVHVPSYGKAIIEIDTRAITIDGTAGTPVEDYVYNTFEHQNTDGGFATKDDLSAKQDDLSVRKVYARRNSSANKYILLATIDMSKITYIGQPLRIKGVIGNMASDITNIDLVINARNGFVKKILSGTVTHKNFLTNDANIIITKSDDEKTAYVYLYCISAYGYIDAEIYLGSVHYSVPSTFDLVETMQGTEYTNLLDTNYVVIESVINDTSTGDTTSTWSSNKIASELKTSSNTDVTAITFDETKVTATSGGHGCTYVVRNGICYVNMDMRIVANGKICTLPKPLMSVVNIPMTVFMHNITGEVEAVNNGILMVNSDGSATTLGALTNESRYMMNFSYPIA